MPGEMEDCVTAVHCWVFRYLSENPDTDPAELAAAMLGASLRMALAEGLAKDQVLEAVKRCLKQHGDKV